MEHTFGILKSRWRILKYINVNCPKKASKIIAACCVLHNFCLINLDDWTGELEEEIGIIEENNNDNLNVNENNLGLRKREHISHLLME